MSDRVKKKAKSKNPHLKTVQRVELLESILRSPITMKRPCSFCESRELRCEASPSDSSRCLECVRRGRSQCDVFGVSVQQLNRIVAQHDKLESEMEKAEAELATSMAKVNRLRLQKRMWFEKMARAISRGIDTVEELERVEREEAEALAAAEASADPPAAPSIPPCFDDDFAPLWDNVYPEVPLEPSLMADFGLIGGGPSFLAGQGSSGGTPSASQGSGGS